MTEEYTEETPLNSLDISQGADVIIPDLWQQQAIAALREGKDVVVQAPTGSGKTYIFESYVKNLKGEKQAVYTVPTRITGGRTIISSSSRIVAILSVFNDAGCKEAILSSCCTTSSMTAPCR